ncbi:MAG: acyl-CoA dehydrogenase [Candidatus Lambdaproteobacteria bacterium RIFOXYD1_FULL_56_27]|uniref:Acyl-CoA dehydrogenase n=1 Tax=Candidatus Lambdaproteobacteria bacterium RIFOXYD2_FULL_56_26 TaxID=1817773 RepID=A0A1F6GZY5_9PROT|nr:MAG: acyl-CoA dehydrogenase [Candidatus Lambdaproteobacteria bacterium RIFOXYC1_FULL_56_13]OGH03611.1 MAG: acyl-CoA dehydrogenase [Candidatus Lambdaproteobacteria bacterium RIFOXYD2_FULL_56_26]OGH06798.1 MAG: acyl-CoA dehydrogenase [Candidatus Lambdaproteobacteria bacterium RIFOXYD1_FULL_56_27]
METKLLAGAEYLIRSSDPDSVFVPEDFTDEHKQIRDTTYDFVVAEVFPQLEAIDHQDFGKVKELLAKAGELGLLMTDTPEEYGGLDLDKVTSMVIAENIARTGSFSVSFTAHTGIGTLPLVYYGTAAQKEKYLGKLITGEWVAAYCLTEPGSGSDALDVASTATLEGDHYVLNGTKQFITNGGIADFFTVFVKIDKEQFTAFLVERTFPGVTIGPEEKKLGIKGSSTTQVILDNVKVPKDNLLGQIGKGHKIAFNILNIGRMKLGACVNGAAKQAILPAIEYAKERKQFGHPIAHFGAIQQKFADSMAELYASESLVYRLAGNLDQCFAGLDKKSPDHYAQQEAMLADYSAECAIAKVYCSEMLQRLVDEVLQIHGGYGFLQEYPAERFYRDERINRIYEGTNEINRLLVPGTILKKALKGQLPLQKKALAAFEALMSPSLESPDPADPFGPEKQAVENAKQIFLILAGAAVQKLMDRLQNEQEILLCAADVAIELYAMESAVLRAAKVYPKASAAKKALYKALAQVVVFSSLEKLGTAAKQGAFYIEEGDTLNLILGGIRRYTKYDASGLLAAKRLIAKETLEQGKYPL